MTWSVTGAPPESLSNLWPTVMPLLRPAVKRSGGRVTLATLANGLREKRYQLWVAHHSEMGIAAAFVTRVATYPNRRTLVVDFAGGTRMTEWVDLAQRTFREYALQAGLSGVELYGRPGWLRMLGRLGWQQEFVVMSVDVAVRGTHDG